jgi:hypothetical protein
VIFVGGLELRFSNADFHDFVLGLFGKVLRIGRLFHFLPVLIGCLVSTICD